MASEGEGQACVAQGVVVAGVRLYMTRLRPYGPTTQCFRCQGFSHDPRVCKAPPRCRFDSEAHHTTYHICRILVGVVGRRRSKASQSKGSIASVEHQDMIKEIVHRQIHVEIWSRSLISQRNGERADPWSDWTLTFDCSEKEENARRTPCLWNFARGSVPIPVLSSFFSYT